MGKQRRYLTAVNVSVHAILLMVGGVTVLSLISSSGMKGLIWLSAAITFGGCGLLLYAIKLSRESG